MAMYSTPSVSPASKTGTMWGWSIAAATWDSWVKRLRKVSLRASSGASSFSATVRSRRRSWAR